MSKLVSLALGGLVIAGALAAPAQSHAQVQFPGLPGQPVAITGCLYRSNFGNRCLLIRDINTGVSYQINSAVPLANPMLRRAITLTGLTAPIFDTCMAGPVLQNIRWRYAPRLCPPLAPAQ